MGNVNLKDETQTMKDKTKDFLAEFVKQYAIFSAAGILKENEKKAEIEAEHSKYKLKWVPEKGPKPDQHEGYLMRRTTILKKWKKVYVVVRGNWTVEYWNSEEDFKANKKAINTLNLSGTRLYKDPNASALDKLEKFCEKAKIDISEVPKPAKLPDHTMRIQDWSERRPEVLFQAENEEDFEKWCKVLDSARYYVKDLNVDEPVHAYAFPRALRRARWHSGCWGYYWGGGGEYQYLTDSISDAVDDAVMPSVDNKLWEAKLGYGVRSKVRNQFLKTCGSFIGGAVKPAWDGAFEASKKARPSAEENVMKAGDPLMENKKKIKDEIGGSVADKAKEAFGSDQIKPHLEKILEAAFEPISCGFGMLPAAFDSTIGELDDEFKPEAEKKLTLVKKKGWSGVRDAYSKCRDLYDPIHLLGKVFDCSAWSVVSGAQHLLEDIWCNALYTFECAMADDGMDRAAAAAHTRALLLEDCVTGFFSVLVGILKDVLNSFWETLVVNPAREIVRPLADKVPEDFKTFLDVLDMLDDVLNDVLKQCCAGVVEPMSAKVKECLAGK